MIKTIKKYTCPGCWERVTEENIAGGVCRACIGFPMLDTRPNLCMYSGCEADLDEDGEENEDGKILCTKCNRVQEKRG